MDENLSIPNTIHSMTLLTNCTSILPVFEKMLDSGKYKEQGDWLEGIIGDYCEGDTVCEEDEENEEKVEIEQ